MKLNKLESAWSSLAAPTPTYILANDTVEIEPKVLGQLDELAHLGQCLQRLGIQGAGIDRIVATPDLHVGSPFPVGVAIKTHGLVIPGAVGNDIGCGMRLCVFDLVESDLVGKYEILEKNLRHIFFEGARDIVMSPNQRRSILENGLLGLIETFADNQGHGIWSLTSQGDLESQFAKTHEGGSLAGKVFAGHNKWVKSSGDLHGYDSQIGVVSQGNHFVEMQIIDEIADAFAAKQYGLTKGQLAVMIHTGSNVLGMAVGSHYRDLAKTRTLSQFAHASKLISNHLFPLIGNDDIANYMADMSAAANFATINRLTLAMMMQKALIKTLGREVEMKLVWDAPHNLTWRIEGGAFIHRKGATPAHGASSVFNYVGEPVLLPGSMGDSSWVLQGLGAERSLESASHGAGRALSRGKASHKLDGKSSREEIKLVLPIDLRALELKGRMDLVSEVQKRLNEEDPLAYKPVTPALHSLEQAKAAKRVAKLRPILTIKEI